MSSAVSFWWPVALTSELDAAGKRSKPLACKLRGEALVLFRDERGKACAMLDYCPHRLMPLSAGRVCQGEMQCAYHGWRFKGDGHCSSIPGMQLPVQTKAIASVVPCHEAEGLVWVTRVNESPFVSTNVAPQVEPLDLFFLTSRIHTTLDQAAENFLDGFHTHYVHSGWIRTSAKRQKIHVKVVRLTDGIEARYEGEGKQSGVVSRLFESSRAWSAGRFRMPGLAEIEYHGDKGLSVLVSAWLVPEDGEHIKVLARVATPRRRAPAWFKRLILRRLFSVILEQDKRVVETQQRNRERFPEVKFLDSPIDLLGPSIRKLINGEQLPGSVERELEVAL